MFGSRVMTRIPSCPTSQGNIFSSPWFCVSGGNFLGDQSEETHYKEFQIIFTLLFLLGLDEDNKSDFVLNCRMPSYFNNFFYWWQVLEDEIL